MPFTCTSTQNSIFSNTDTFITWFSPTKTIIDNMTSTTPSTTVADKSKEIMEMSLCLETKLESITGTANDISRAQEEILNLNHQISKEEENISIAKDRVGYIRNPEENVSNYESWFPIDRPMHTSSLIIILSISLFLLIFCLLLLSSFLGIDIMIYRRPSIESYRSNILYKIYSQFTSLTWVVLIALVGVLIYFLTKK